MKRIILLLLPVVALAVGAPVAPGPQAREETTSRLWQASLTAESNGDAMGALDKLTAFAKGGGESYMASLRAGWLHYNSKQYDEAARCYLAAAKLQPNALNPRLGLLNVARAKNDGAAAIAAADAVLKIESTNYQALSAVAWGAFQAKDYRRSSAAYQRILSLYPENIDAMSGAAWCGFYTGQKREARDGFRRLMSFNSEYSYARQGLLATSR